MTPRGRSADVVVIGGGIAGVTVAAELATNASVVLVEAERTLAHHATGRSAATLAMSYGGQEVRRLTAAGLSLFDAPPPWFDGPLLTRRPCVWFARRDDAWRAYALVTSVADTAPGVRLVAGAELTDACRVLRPGVAEVAVVDDDAFDIDVHALHTGFVRAAKAHGATILTDWRVAAIVRRGDRWRVTSPGRDTIKASTVVIAAGPWANVVAGLAGVAPLEVTSRRRTAFVAPSRTSPPEPDGPLVADLGGRFYVKPERGLYLCSPIDHMEIAPCDVRPEEVAIARGLDAINEATRLELRSVSASWAGLQSVPTEGKPLVGPDPTADGLFWLVGQAGHGIQTAPALARLAAALVLGRKVPEDLAAAGFDATTLAPRRTREGAAP